MTDQYMPYINLKVNNQKLINAIVRPFIRLSSKIKGQKSHTELKDFNEESNANINVR